MKNQLRKVEVIEGEYAGEPVVFVPLTQGHRAIVDAEEWPFIVEAYGDRWCAVSNGNGRVYAARQITWGHQAGRMMTLARSVVDAPTGSRIQPKNGDSLDVRRSNLKLIRPKEAAKIGHAFAEKRRAEVRA